MRAPRTPRRSGWWTAEIAREWGVLVAGECPYVKNREAKRSKRFFALRARRKIDDDDDE